MPIRFSVLSSQFSLALLASTASASASSPITHHSSLLNAIRRVETGGHPNGGRDTRGDGGRSLGPYQIQRSYWRDAGMPGSYGQVRDRRYAERVMRSYWERYCPRALARGDLETLARVHNGGALGARKRSTVAYWHKVRKELRRE